MPPLILITRPRESAQTFAADLRAELGPDADICIAPLLEIEHICDLPDLTQVQTLIFTSAHAVASVANATRRRDFTCYTVGGATAETAHTSGFTPIIGPGTGKDLAALILQDAPDTPCLHLRGDHVAFDIAKYLNAAGIKTRSATVYRQVARTLSGEAKSRLKDAGPIIAPVFSPRSAQLLLDALRKDTNLLIAAISSAAAEVIPPDRALQVRIAECPDKAAMLTCVAKLWRNANQLEGGSTAQ